MEPNSDISQPQPTLTSTPPVSSVVPTSKPKSSGMLFMGGILILGLGFTIGLLFNKNLSPTSQISPTPTPLPAEASARESDPTANWKTYIDSKYGFSINLPGYYQTENKSWTTDESVNYLSISPQPGNYEGCCFKKSDPISIGSKSILMESYQNIGINDWKIKSRFATSHKFIKENVFNENGLSFTKFTALSLGQTGFADDDRLTGFFIQKGSTLIVISVNHFSENQNEAELFTDQILSTFKFLNDEASSGSIQYKDVTSGYQFSYPSEWKLIRSVPQEFKYEDRYQNDYNQWVKWINTQEGLAQWLNGKMFVGQTCRGPLLQNTQAPSQLIAIEIVPSSADGGFCWSTGHFFDNNKWKVTDKYAYPVGSSNQTTIEPQWKGDFFVFRELGGNNSWKVFLGLANRETYSLKGEGVVDQILSTFKFTN